MSTKQDILRIWEGCWGQASPEDRVRFLREPAVEVLARSSRICFVMLAIRRHQSPTDAVSWLKGLGGPPSRGRYRVKGSAKRQKARSGTRGKKTRPKALAVRGASGGPVLDSGGSCGGPQRPHDARLHKRIGPTMRYGDDT